MPEPITLGELLSPSVWNNAYLGLKFITFTRNNCFNCHKKTKKSVETGKRVKRE